MLNVLFITLCVVAAIFGENANVDGPSPVVGVYSGLVNQQGSVFNMTLNLWPGGTGSAAFWNPGLGFACAGHVQSVTAGSYIYSLTLDNSRVANACLNWGNMQVSYTSGSAAISMYPHGQSAPAFSAYLPQLV